MTSCREEMCCNPAPASCWRFCLAYVRKHVPKVRSLFHPRIAEALQRLIKESSCLCVRQGREAPFWVCRNRSRVECNYLALHFTRRLAKPREVCRDFDSQSFCLNTKPSPPLFLGYILTSEKSPLPCLAATALPPCALIIC